MRKEIVLVVVIASLAGICNFGFFLGTVFFLRFDLERLHRRLLCETDHEALLQACREVSQQAMAGEMKSRSYRTRCFVFSTPAAAKFPKPIRDLRPRHVMVGRDGHVRLEMFSGWSPFGVCAYPEGYEKRFPKAKYRDRKLIDGLWYYDVEYLHFPEEYDEAIDDLLRKCGKLREGIDGDSGVVEETHGQ